jgi:hypothetical protein
MGTATPYVTEFWGTVGMGAVAGAAGAAASQVVLIAGGEQNGFDWKGVAMGAVGGAVTAGVAQGMPALSSNAFVQGFAQGAVGSIATQGVEVATGLQSHFDWRGVAASAIASGVSAGVADRIGQSQYGDTGWKDLNSQPLAVRNATLMNDLGQTMTRSIASGLAGGAASALVRGGSFKNNLSGVLRDVVASTIGNSIVDQMTGASTRTTDFERRGGQFEADFERWGRQFEADMAEGRVQLLADNTPARNPLHDILNGPNTMSTDEDNAIFSVKDFVEAAKEVESKGLTVNRTDDQHRPLNLRTMSDVLDKPQGWAGLGSYDAPPGDFVKGFQQGNSYRSVMEPPMTTAEWIGRFAGASVDAFVDFGGEVIGAKSWQSMLANGRAGNYGIASLYAVKAIGEAGTTVLSLGTMAAERTVATRILGDWTTARVTYGTNNISRSDLGDLLGRGGNKDVYAYGDSQAVGILRTGTNSQVISDEIDMLGQLHNAGMPTVNPQALSIDGAPGMLMDRFAQGSKDVVRLVDGKVRVVGESPLLNQQSIADLQGIRDTMVNNKIQINDLQFLISNEGRVVVADPLAVNFGSLPSKNNLRMIDLLIQSAQKKR